MVGPDDLYTDIFNRPLWGLLKEGAKEALEEHLPNPETATLQQASPSLEGQGRSWG